MLLAHASIEESRQLAQKVPHFDVVVRPAGAGEPTYEAEQIAGTNALLVQVGIKGMYVGVVGVFDDRPSALRYQRVPLDDRFADSREMLDLLASYQEQLKAAGLEGLGVKPHPVSQRPEVRRLEGLRGVPRRGLRHLEEDRRTPTPWTR